MVPSNFNSRGVQTLSSGAGAIPNFRRRLLTESTLRPNLRANSGSGRVQILDESDVVVMLVESGLMYSREISSLFSDERKFCPKSESEMELKTNRVQGTQFWGCKTFPRCNSTLKLES
jgi:hypothetical protein